MFVSIFGIMIILILYNANRLIDFCPVLVRAFSFKFATVSPYHYLVIGRLTQPKTSPDFDLGFYFRVPGEF